MRRLILLHLVHWQMDGKEGQGGAPRQQQWRRRWTTTCVEKEDAPGQATRRKKMRQDKRRKRRRWARTIGQKDGHAIGQAAKRMTMRQDKRREEGDASGQTRRSDGPGKQRGRIRLASTNGEGEDGVPE